MSRLWLKFYKAIAYVWVEVENTYTAVVSEPWLMFGVGVASGCLLMLGITQLMLP